MGYSGDVVFSGGAWLDTFSGAIGSTVQPLLGANYVLSHAPCDFQASRIFVQLGTFQTYGELSDVSVFDCPGIFLQYGNGAMIGMPIRMNASARLYGTGNVGYLLEVARGSSVVFFTAANCFATTSATKPISLVGVATDYADLPLLDAANLAAVWVT